MTQNILILGANGNAGQHAAEAFSAAGWIVTPFDRKQGDLNKAAQGQDVIFNGWNPPNYHNWKTLIPAMTDQIIEAAKASGATVLMPGNVYNFGTHPAPWSDETPQRPNSRKGQIRKEMEDRLKSSGVRTIILRAGDFISSKGPANVMGRIMLAGLKKGKITRLGAPDVTRAYAYLPDWAKGAVALAEQRDTLPAFCDVAFPGHSFSVDQLHKALEVQTGHKLRITKFPWWLMTMASPFWELAREFREMRYLYDHPHHLDGRKFHALVPDFTPTPFETVITGEMP